MRSSTLLLPHVILALTTPSLCISLDRRNWEWKRALSLWTRADERNVPSEGYYDPSQSGGSMLTKIPVTFPMGQGEPINAIITGSSDSRVLVDAEVNGGLRNYFVSFGFSGECLGQHSGSDQEANLGDGNGFSKYFSASLRRDSVSQSLGISPENETGVIRWAYGDPELGTCKETIQGGNHFRYWVQDGPSANSGAIFLAVSYEKPIAEQHDIIPNGYNLGRDWLVGNITQSAIPTLNLTNSTTYTGTTSSGGYTYETSIRYVPGLLANSSDGINHNITVGVDGINAADGLVAVLDVRITQTPPTSSCCSHVACDIVIVATIFYLLRVITVVPLAPPIMSLWTPSLLKLPRTCVL
ncbi:hypothetical protein D9756_005104 [Leucocoprinus leucothites]|uniref:Uncharacterized protein n=1 Tax=Leucocoprinus leucothites TaxID=201217 RepID=A0A8H5G9H3_9AGAR|nr:hypothetical protein D9756_005104 [Leucoagaricus leucothites]